MAGYSFKNRSDIEAVLKLIGKNPKGQIEQGVRERPRITHGWIFKTPIAGIPARSGTTLGSASCQPYYIETGGVLTILNDEAGNPQTMTVYHIGASPIAGGAYILCKEVFGWIVADMEDCA